MPVSIEQLQKILEAAILVAGHPLPKAEMLKLFDETDQPEAQEIQTALKALQEKYRDSGIELRELASGFQFQARTELSSWLVKLWEERPKRYSRAFLETLALIAYRQPITRAEIEEIRGVTVSSDIIKTLMEREWIKIIGYKEVPGKPALFGTTKTFLDYFSLKSLDQLPTLQEIKDLESQEAKLQVQLELSEAAAASTSPDANSSENEMTEIPTQEIESEIIEITEETEETEELEIIEITDEKESETKENPQETESTP